MSLFFLLVTIPYFSTYFYYKSCLRNADFNGRKKLATNFTWIWGFLWFRLKPLFIFCLSQSPLLVGHKTHLEISYGCLCSQGIHLRKVSWLLSFVVGSSELLFWSSIAVRNAVMTIAILLKSYNIYCNHTDFLAFNR